jgi:hypothetical protein
MSSRPFATRHLLVSSALVLLACAKASELDSDTPDPYKPNGGKGGSGGSAQSGSGGSAQSGSAGSAQSGSGGSAQSGSGGSAQGGSAGTGQAGKAGGSSGGSGGSSAGTGNTSGTGNGGTGESGTGGTGGTGGATGGGGGATAGGTSSGGTDATGGVSGSGGSGGAGGTASGGTGGVIVIDPNFMPPDMSDAPLQVMYQAEQTANSSRDVRFILRFKNQTDASYSIGGLTLRYWMSSEPPPRLAVDYSTTNLALMGTPTFVGNGGNSYVEFRFGAAGAVAPYVDQNTLTQHEVRFRMDTSNNTNFDQSNDWSFDRTAAANKINGKITMHDGATLVWGCEPSKVCAEAAPPTGDAGAGGQSAL